jgi:DNA-binding MarR family transcriptional regulator
VLTDDRWLTAKELARARGVQTGSIFGTLRRMHADRWVEADSDPDPPTRGTQYRITSLGRTLLEAALAEEQPPGQLELDQDVVIVEQGKRGRRIDFERIVHDVKLSGRIAWAATLGWGWLLVFEAGVNELDVTRLVVALEGAGFRCRVAQPRSLLSGAALREQAEAYVGTAGVR